MTKAEFKKVWKSIEGKPVKVKYGKSTFPWLMLVKYNEALWTVKTSEQGELSTVAIKSIELLKEPVKDLFNDLHNVKVIEPKEEPVEAEPDIEAIRQVITEEPELVFDQPEEVVVTKHIPVLLDKGYFKFTCKFAGNWKKCVVMDSSHNPVMIHSTLEETEAGKPLQSESYFTHRELFDWVVKTKKEYPLLTPMVLIDDTWLVPQYYRIKQANNDYFFNKIED